MLTALGLPDSCLSLLLISATNCLRYPMDPSQANLVPQLPPGDMSVEVTSSGQSSSPLPVFM